MSSFIFTTPEALYSLPYNDFNIYMICTIDRVKYGQIYYLDSDQALHFQLLKGGIENEFSTKIVDKFFDGKINIVKTNEINLSIDLEGEEKYHYDYLSSFAYCTLYPEVFLDILYIGQSFAKGKRNAVKRLKKHDILQRILTEKNTKYFDKDIIIFLLKFDSNNNVIIPKKNDDYENKIDFNNRFIQATRGCTKQEIINLAEAGLIYFFKPEYNTYLKKNNINTMKLKCCDILKKNDYDTLRIEMNDSSSLNTHILKTKEAEYNIKDPKTAMVFSLVDDGLLSNYDLINKK